MPDIDFTWLFIKMVVALVISCVAAILILRYAVPRLGWTKKWQKNRYFEVIARFPLEAKRALYLVRIGKKRLVLGASEGGIHKVAELSEEDLAGE